MLPNDNMSIKRALNFYWTELKKDLVLIFRLLRERDEKVWEGVIKQRNKNLLLGMKQIRAA
jgi:hypothetical protein